MFQLLRDNDQKLLEVIFREIRKINPEVLIEISYYPSVVRVQIQTSDEYRGKIFNKLHHIHNIYGLQFSITQFIKRDKGLISFDLRKSI